MVSTIHNATIVNKGRKDENKQGNKEALCCCPVQYIHKGHRQGRPVPPLLFSSEENRKMVEKSGTASAKVCSLQCIFFVCTGH